MIGGGGDKRRRPQSLSEEDAALWRYVTRNVRPSGGKNRVAARVVPGKIADASGDEGGRPRPAAPSNAMNKSKPARKQKDAVSPAQPAAEAVRQKAAKPDAQPRHVVLERRKARRIGRGGIDIEARLDLHGMTQDEAYGALQRFMRRAAADGLRTVLVITGKGGPDTRHEEDRDGSIPYGRRERGVLKRNVPRWLAEPDLRPLVASYSTAHIRHGGEGALYVMLRRMGD